ncbi:MAG: prepilin-type N-terminal cleavage/methylation domain-containing protein, partial [Clostridia bacterium]|nr:prepilin-type N-terminal cleavage/methylation domain-containing protein [Clostridia bacterium]
DRGESTERGRKKMLHKIRKMPYCQQGFTLIELMTVLIILGVIMSIGIPKYLMLQAQAEYDADVITIENIARAAEVYVTQKNSYAPVLLSDLITKNIIDGELALNRINSSRVSSNDSSNTSIKNEKKEITLDDYSDIVIIFNSTSGRVDNLDGDEGIIVEMIGKPLYQ